jgi:hypothetical protein
MISGTSSPCTSYSSHAPRLSENNTCLNTNLTSTVHPLYVKSTLNDDHIISLCYDPTKTVLSASQCSNKVVRITDSLAVKFGHFVTAQEFRNQQVA